MDQFTKTYRTFYSKHCYQALKYRFRIRDPGSGKTYSGSGIRGQKGTRSPIRNTKKLQVCEHLTLVRIWPVSEKKAARKLVVRSNTKSSVADGDPVPFWPLDPGWVYSGSRIPNSYFWELSDNFLGRKFHYSWKFGPNIFLEQFKTKIILHFVKFVATKKCLTKYFFNPLFCSCFCIRDPRSRMDKNQDPGWTSRIRNTNEKGRIYLKERLGLGPRPVLVHHLGDVPLQPLQLTVRHLQGIRWVQW